MLNLAHLPLRNVAAIIVVTAIHFLVTSSGAVFALDLATIRDAWKLRQFETANFSIEWGSLRYGPVSITGDQAREMEFRFLSDGKGRHRFEENWERDESRRGDGVSRQSRVVAFDGSTVWELTQSSSNPAPFVQIRDNPSTVLSRIDSLRPIWLLTGNLPGSFSDTDQSQPEIETGVNDLKGHMCHVIRWNMAELWIDSDATTTFLPRRLIERTESGGTNEIEINYKLDGNEWAPLGWTLTMMTSNGRIATSETAMVKLFTVAPEFADRDFVFDVPAETYVRDLRGADQSGGGRDFTIKADGAERTILKGEFNGRNFDDVLTSEAGDLLPPPRSRLGLWMIVGNIVIVLVLLPVFYFRRKKKLA